MAFGVFNRITNLSEHTILDRIRQGDEKALALLYKRYYSMVIKLIISNSGTEEEGKDVYQDALISLWRKIRSGELIIYSKISTYLYGVCLNLWKKELKRKKKLSYKQKDEVESMRIDDLENRKIIASYLAQLGPICKKILEYYYFDGRSMQEIADELGFANSNTVKTRKYKCKQRFKELIELQYAKQDLLD